MVNLENGHGPTAGTPMSGDEAPPRMAAWNLALRFGLEMAALAALGVAGWTLAPGLLRWLAVVALPLVAAAAWGVFNVVGDPSRSGSAPIEVPGWARLGVELAVLGGGAVALAVSGRAALGAALGLLIVLQYATSWARVRWLLER
jgi:hypothetical protein